MLPKTAAHSGDWGKLKELQKNKIPKNSISVFNGIPNLKQNKNITK